MTRSELLEVVYRFYPRGVHPFGFLYDGTPERQRQREATRRGAAGYPTWRALLARLRPRYTLSDNSLGILLAESYMPGYGGFVEIPGYKVGFHVSLLGPYYGIPRSGAPGEEEAALDLAREIEVSYPGYQPIPPELGNEVLPDVETFGKTTIYNCLLSDVWHVSSGPLSPPRAWPDEPPGDADPREPPDLDPDADLGGGTARVFLRWVNGQPEWGVK
jgi:hypothetical protein